MSGEPWTAPAWIEPEWTTRQLEVLALIGAGGTDTQIAEVLDIPPVGVSWYVDDALSKLGVSSRDAVADYWRWRMSRRKRLGRNLRSLTALSVGNTSVCVVLPLALAALGVATVALSVAAVLTLNQDSAEPALPAESPTAIATESPAASSSTTTATATANPMASAATALPATPTTAPVLGIIDWIETFRFNGVQYVPGRQTGFSEAALGPKFAEVLFTISENVTDPSYRIKDGDATFLAAGTKVYEVQGYSPQFSQARRAPGRAPRALRGLQKRLRHARKRPLRHPGKGRVHRHKRGRRRCRTRGHHRS